MADRLYSRHRADTNVKQFKPIVAVTICLDYIIIVVIYGLFYNAHAATKQRQRRWILVDVDYKDNHADNIIIR